MWLISLIKGKATLIIGAVIISLCAACAFLWWQYSRQLEKNAYLESAVESHLATIEALQDYNKKRDVVALDRIKQIEELQNRKQQTKVIVRELEKESPEWSNTDLPTGHADLLRQRSAQSRDG